MNEKEIDRFKKGEDDSSNTQMYSMQRFDIIIVSVSSAGIYVNIEILKWVIENDLDFHYCLNKIAIFILVGGIISNLIGQYYSFLSGFRAKTHYKQLLDYEAGLEGTKGKIEKKCNKRIEEDQNYIMNCNRYSKYSNQFALILFIMGLLVSLIFMVFI